MNTSDNEAAKRFELDFSGTANNSNQFGEAETVNIYNYPPPGGGRRPPRELPAPSRRFLNRSQELELLDQLLEDNEDPFAPRLLLVDGEDGVGKTNLVARWAGRIDQRFPDGIVYCDVAKYASTGITNVVEVLGSLLSSLDVERERMQNTVEGRARQWRSACHGLNLLVVLDNIEEPALLSDLLPASASATVVLISRLNAAAFIAEGADRVEVPPFNVEHSRKLLSKVCGEQRLRQEPEAVSGLLDLCGGRPGTVALLGGCIATSRQRSLGELLREIAAQAADRSHDIAAVISRRVVVASLSEAERELYRRLSAHPGEDFGVELAEALAGPDAARLLTTLEDQDLVTVKPSGRRHIPEEPAVDPAAARQVLDWYLAMARYADNAVMRTRLRLTEVDLSAAEDPGWNRESEGLDWLEAEVPNLVALQRTAIDHGWDYDAVAIEESLWVAYLRRPFPGYQETTSQLAVAAAVRLTDPRLESRMRAQRGRRLWQREAFGEALEESSRARELAAGDDDLSASAAEMTGRVYLAQGEYDKAIEVFDFALEIYDRIGNVRGAALVRQFMARSRVARREYESAGSLLREAMNGLRANGSSGDKGRVLLDVAKLNRRMGEHSTALSVVDESAEFLAAAGFWSRLAEAAQLRGDLLSDMGQAQSARAAWQQSLDIQLSQHNGDGPEASQLRARLAAP